MKKFFEEFKKFITRGNVIDMSVGVIVGGAFTSIVNALSNNILKYFIASLVGLIPNCASSIIITELYLSNLITIGTMFAGLLTGSGLGILLLFKVNKNLKENIIVLSTIYGVGVVVGFIIDLII